MKKIYRIMAVASIVSLASCELDLYPVTGYNEGNVVVDEDTESQYTTKEDISGLISAMYNSWLKSNVMQEGIFLDGMVFAECRADNAYGGNPGTGELMAIEANKQDGDNKNVKRDWDYYQEAVGYANQIVCNIDRIKESDPSMTDLEYNQWKSQGLCMKAYALYQMSLIWGDIPVQNSIPPAITAENVEVVYFEYYPPRTAKDDVYKQLIDDLTFAAENGPDVNPSNKYLLSKAFAHGMLARVYAEKSAHQDWTKVAEHCEAVEGMGFTLCDDYGQMWAYDDNDAVRNTSESIFEVTWTRDNGNWIWMMYHRNYYSPNDQYTWIKWITPSRDLIAAYQAEGDTERANACITYDQTGTDDKSAWANYYPADNYAFMHKCPTNASSTILMRLGEIYLLHAEALCMTGDLAGSTEYVNKIRRRAGIKEIAQPADQDAMIDAVLHERRLELAFEGFRFWDLVRHGKAREVHDAMSDPSSPRYDKYWQQRRPLTDETILMPIPQEALENNPSLVQNPGY